MKHMVFAYGTLTDPVIRNNLLGRDVQTRNDFLSGYRPGEIFLDGEKYPAISKNSSWNKPVKGMVFEVTTAELEAIDGYESDAYKRVKERLKSGLEAWVYVRA